MKQAVAGLAKLRQSTAVALVTAASYAGAGLLGCLDGMKRQNTFKDFTVTTYKTGCFD